MTLPLSRHELIPHLGTGDPVCRCGWYAPSSATIRTVHQAAARVSRHAAVRNRLEARPVVYRVKREPPGYHSPTTGTRAPWLVYWPGERYADGWSATHQEACAMAHLLARHHVARRTLGSPPQRQDTTP